MVESALPEVQKWEEKVSQEEGGMADVDVEPGVHDIAGRIIARTVFSSEFEQGREVCKLQNELIKVLFQVLMDPKFWIPGSRYVATENSEHIAKVIPEAILAILGQTGPYYIVILIAHKQRCS